MQFTHFLKKNRETYLSSCSFQFGVRTYKTYFPDEISQSVLYLLGRLPTGGKGAVLNEHEDGHQVSLHHHHLFDTMSIITPPTLPSPRLGLSF